MDERRCRLNETEQQNSYEAATASSGPDTLTPESLVHQYASAVLGLCLAHTRTIHDGEDLMQEVFVKALRKFHTLRNRRSARAWLMQIARRTCIDYYRRSVPEEQLPDSIAAPAQSDDPKRTERLYRAISQLPETFREPIMLYYINGRSSATVARNLGISESAVRSRLSRARLRLHELLAEDSK